ncbi:hypothetical protein ACJQWK_01620 [Exserohilum turcicum]
MGTLTLAKDNRSEWDKVPHECQYCWLKVDTCRKLCQDGLAPCAYECQIKTCMQYTMCKKCPDQLPACKYAKLDG